MATDDSAGDSSSGLAVVPGVAGGEGCSTAGGCATCPFMKMNDLDALHDVVDMVEADPQSPKLKAFLPPDRVQGKKIDGVSAVELGSEPILFMRQFMQEKAIPDALVKKIGAEI
jgi:quinolinate synthase